MATRLKFIRIEQKSNRKTGKKFTPQLEKSTDYVILNPGKLSIDYLKGIYEFELKIFPANLLDDTKDTESNKKTKYWLNALIDSRYNYLTVPGRVINSDYTYKAFVKTEKILSFISNDDERPLKLYNFLVVNNNLLVNEGLLPLLKELGGSFFVVIPQGEIKVLLPCAEIARWYYFTGPSLSTDLFTYENFYPKECILTRDEKTNERVLFGKFFHKLTSQEIKTLALLILSPYAQKKSEQMYRWVSNSDNLENIKYILAHIPHEGKIKMGTTGFYIDKEKKCFMVMQIHQSIEEKTFFDRIDYLPYPDFRSTNDDTLPQKTGRKNNPGRRKKINPSKDEKDNSIVAGPPDANSILEVLQDDMKLLNFFEVNEAHLIRLDKTEQDYSYTGELTFYQKNGKGYSSEPGNPGDNDIATLRELLFSREAYNALHILIDTCTKLSTEKSLEVTYLALNNTDGSMESGDTAYVNTLRETKSIIVKLDYHKKYFFYLIDICFESENELHYIGFFYTNELSAFSYETIKLLLDAKIDTRSSWGKLKTDNIITAVEVEQLNRKSGSVEIAKRIKNKVLKLIKSKSNISANN